MIAMILDFLRIVLSWPVMTAVVALTFIHRFEPEIRARLAGAQDPATSKTETRERRP